MRHGRIQRDELELVDMSEEEKQKENPDANEAQAPEETGTPETLQVPHQQHHQQQQKYDNIPPVTPVMQPI